MDITTCWHLTFYLRTSKKQRASQQLCIRAINYMNEYKKKLHSIHEGYERLALDRQRIASAIAASMAVMQASTMHELTGW